MKEIDTLVQYHREMMQMRKEVKQYIDEKRARCRELHNELGSPRLDAGADFSCGDPKDLSFHIGIAIEKKIGELTTGGTT